MIKGDEGIRKMKVVGIEAKTRKHELTPRLKENESTSLWVTLPLAVLSFHSGA